MALANLPRGLTRSSRSRTLRTYLVEDIEIVCERIASGRDGAIVRLENGVVKTTEVGRGGVETVRHDERSQGRLIGLQ